MRRWESESPLRIEILDDVGDADTDIAIFPPSHRLNHTCSACHVGINHVLSIVCVRCVASARWEVIAGAFLRLHRILDTSMSNMNTDYAESCQYCLLCLLWIAMLLKVFVMWYRQLIGRVQQKLGLIQLTLSSIPKIQQFTAQTQQLGSVHNADIKEGWKDTF